MTKTFCANPNCGIIHMKTIIYYYKLYNCTKLYLKSDQKYLITKYFIFLVLADFSHCGTSCRSLSERAESCFRKFGECRPSASQSLYA